MQALSLVGNRLLITAHAIGSAILMVSKVVVTIGTTKPPIGRIIQQIEQIGVESLGITLGTGLFAGAVLAMQSYKGFSRVGGTGMVGPVVALTMIRELGPVFTGIMVAGRAGSSMTAELGTMKITEQLDALKTLGIDLYHYLLVPRFLGCMVAVPILALFSMTAGILGGYLVSAWQVHLNTHEYLHNICLTIEPFDILGGLCKSLVFGIIIAWVGCYQGLQTGVGASGVGKATTATVVVAAMSIVVANYLLAVILFGV
ncbi:ABC transporter permease [Candidatus Dependentiae bacterium]|nr:ABC transporter permease [Candidatus Dependentiae bacterium]